jgi:hypothetical protein
MAGAGTTQTSTLKLSVPICAACVEKYKAKRVRLSLIAFGVTFALFAGYTLLGGTLQNNLFWGFILGLGIGGITGNMAGKPFFHSSKTCILFDNDRYQRLFKEANPGLVDPILSEPKP